MAKRKKIESVLVEPSQHHVDTEPHGPPRPCPADFPAFLWRGTPRNHAKIAQIVAETTGRGQRTWIMPSRDSWIARESTAEIMARYEGAKNPELPVSVQVALSDSTGSSKLADYANFAEFQSKHDAKTYPLKRVAELDGVTVVLVSAKPWAGKERTPAKPREGKSKAEIIGDLLLEGGKSRKELCEAVGWPSMSVPGQAKMVGLTLRSEKVDGVLRYWGSKAGAPETITLAPGAAQKLNEIADVIADKIIAKRRKPHKSEEPKAPKRRAKN